MPPLPGSDLARRARIHAEIRDQWMPTHARYNEQGWRSPNVRDLRGLHKQPLRAFMVRLRYVVRSLFRGSR
jgi:hypothetical protein